MITATAAAGDEITAKAGNKITTAAGHEITAKTGNKISSAAGSEITAGSVKKTTTTTTTTVIFAKSATMITTAVLNVLSDNEMGKNATAVPEITTNQNLMKATMPRVLLFLMLPTKV